MIGLSIIVATCGRPSLARTLASIQPQLAPGDELLVDVNDDQPWGHGARNRMMRRARPGNGLAFMDDDDVYASGGLAVIRDAFRAEPECLHLFRMTYAGDVIWKDPWIREGNVSTQLACVAAPVHADFSPRYQGDLDFLLAVAVGRSVRWHEEVVAHYRGVA